MWRRESAPTSPCATWCSPLWHMLSHNSAPMGGHPPVGPAALQVPHWSWAQLCCPPWATLWPIYMTLECHLRRTIQQLGYSRQARQSPHSMVSHSSREIRGMKILFSTCSRQRLIWARFPNSHTFELQPKSGCVVRDQTQRANVQFLESGKKRDGPG